MAKIIMATLVAMAMAMSLVGCASSGPIYTARQLQLENGQQAYRVTCYGLLENGNTCRRQAARICASQSDRQVRVLKGIAAVGQSKPEDERELRFECVSAG